MVIKAAWCHRKQSPQISLNIWLVPDKTYLVTSYFNYYNHRVIGNQSGILLVIKTDLCQCKQLPQIGLNIWLVPGKTYMYPAI